MPTGSEVHGIDIRASLLSLPAIFQAKPGNIPTTVPYLQADAKLVHRWPRSWDW